MSTCPTYRDVLATSVPALVSTISLPAADHPQTDVAGRPEPLRRELSQRAVLEERAVASWRAAHPRRAALVALATIVVVARDAIRR
jgi:hypothetical protein